MWDVSYENFGESGNSGEFGDSGESGETCESESESRVVLGFPELLPTFLFIQGMLFHSFASGCWARTKSHRGEERHLAVKTFLRC